MKTLAEITAIRDKKRAEITLADNAHSARIVVGMATCGIAAGAKPVLETVSNEIKAAGLEKAVIVTQTGCIGICQYEPVMEVYVAGKERVTYVKMDAEKAKRVVEEHIKGGNIVSEYTIGAHA